MLETYLPVDTVFQIQIHILSMYGTVFFLVLNVSVMHLEGLKWHDATVVGGEIFAMSLVILSNKLFKEMFKH